MEAVAAVGLASNVLQFVEFIAKLIRISNELRNNAASSENRNHQVIATHLEAISHNISKSAQAISQTSMTASPEEKASDGCCDLATQLLERLRSCGIQIGQNGSRLQRAKVAFKAIWNKREIEEISSRLQFFRSELNIHYTFQIWNKQVDQYDRQSTTDDIQAVLDRLESLKLSIDSVKLDIDGALSNQRSDIISSLAEMKSDNSQLHTRAAEQARANQTAVLGRLDNYETSINDGFENIKIGLESLASVKVENSTFLATTRQQVPLASELGPVFGNVLRPLFEEYKESFLEEVKKEYRDDILPALGEMQYRSKGVQQNYTSADDEDELGEIQDDYQPTSSSLESWREVLPDAHPRQLGKDSITWIYNYFRYKKTSIGTFSLMIRNRVRFDIFGLPTQKYELTAQFTPSPRWLSTGCSITYKKLVDSRGEPTFCFRLPKIYRVLGEDHEIWDAIRYGDLTKVQSMLSQKLILPSDRGVRSDTMLYLQGWVSVCQLVEFDFNLPGEPTFLEMVICQFSSDIYWKSLQDKRFWHPGLNEIFDAIVRKKIGISNSGHEMDIAVACAAHHLWVIFREAYKDSLLVHCPSTTLSVPYRGYYTHPEVAQRFEFLEHVISKGIPQRPDSIFDTYYGRTISDWFYEESFQHVWEEILEEHGFDVAWVYKENDRRKRVVIGETSTHEVSMGVNASSMRDVRQRRVYENADE
ncbi:hypothetical protein GGR54DRAFT_632994 [Hypoxylon sp. NC1633]|nr:hypothetical protein GGR54DRAFT_632994 [Hypoxylon sp. NC1633]